MKYQRKDAHYRRAKAEGFRARSAYKLVELDNRYKLLRPGNRVADLGAWPGGWMQIAAERIGPAGCVVGVDLMPIEPLPHRNVESIVGDIRDPAIVPALTARLGGRAHVLLSDLAPKLTGVRDADEAQCSELTGAVLEALPSLLQPEGRALVKLFMDPSYSATVAKFRDVFREVRAARADASRRGSAELYVVGMGFHSS